jgi:hypothetical protein
VYRKRTGDFSHNPGVLGQATRAGGWSSWEVAIEEAYAKVDVKKAEL